MPHLLRAAWLLPPLLVTSIARAEPAPPRTSALSWARLPGAETCVGPRDLAQAVEKRLKRPVLASTARADLTIEGHVAPAAPPAHFRAEIRVRSSDDTVIGTRVIDARDPDCAAMTEPLALAIALMVDPNTPDPPPPAAPPAPAPPPAPPPAPAPQTPVEPAPRAPEPPPWHFQVDVGPALSIGLLPSVGPGITLRALLDPRGFPGVQISASSWGPWSGGDGDRRSPRYWIGYGGLALCPLTIRARIVGVTGCAGMAVGVIRELSYGAITDVITHPFLEARVTRRIAGPLIVALGLGGAVPLIRRGFNYSPKFRMAPVAGILDLAVGIEVP